MRSRFSSGSSDTPGGRGGGVWCTGGSGDATKTASDEHPGWRVETELEVALNTELTDVSSTGSTDLPPRSKGGSVHIIPACPSTVIHVTSDHDPINRESRRRRLLYSVQMPQLVQSSKYTMITC